MSDTETSVGIEVEEVGNETAQEQGATNMNEAVAVEAMAEDRAINPEDLLSVIDYREVKKVCERCCPHTFEGRTLKAGIKDAYLHGRALPVSAYSLLTEKEERRLTKRFKTASDCLAILRAEFPAITFADIRSMQPILRSGLGKRRQVALIVALARIRLNSPQWVRRGDLQWVARKLQDALQEQTLSRKARLTMTVTDIAMAA